MPKGSEANFKVAQAFVKQGDIEQALTEYEKLAQIEPKNLQICYDLAELYAKRGLIAKVTDQYLRMADIYFGDNSLDQGIEACQKIIRLEPESIKAREKLIDIYSQMSNRDEVREQCFALSRICSMQGQSEKALDFLQRGIEVDPDNLDARLELAIMNVKQGHIKEGIAQYKEVGQAFWEKGELNKAAETYKRVTVLQPDDTETHLALGTLYRELGQLEDAKNAFRFILRYDLTHIKALTELGLVCQEKGEIDSAILAFRKIVDINPMKIEAYEKLGELYEIRGQSQEAVKQYYTAAEEYHKQSIIDKAIQMCEIILELDCKHAKALRLMKELGYASRPQSVEDDGPVQPRLSGMKDNQRIPRAVGRPQSGIMMIPRDGGTKPLGPTKRPGFRGGPTPGSTMRLNVRPGAGTTAPLMGGLPGKSMTRPLTPLKTMLDDDQSDFSGDTYPNYDQQTKTRHMDDMETSGRTDIPFRNEPGTPPLIASKQEEDIIQKRTFMNDNIDGSSFSQEDSDDGPKPRLISRRFAEDEGQSKPSLIRPRGRQSTSSGELPPSEKDTPSRQKQLDFSTSAPKNEEGDAFSQIPSSNSSSISIGEIHDERDTAPLAFSPDGLEFDYEEEENAPPSVEKQPTVMEEEKSVPMADERLAQETPSAPPEFAVVEFKLEEDVEEEENEPKKEKIIEPEPEVSVSSEPPAEAVVEFKLEEDTEEVSPVVETVQEKIISSSPDIEEKKDVVSPESITIPSSSGAMRQTIEDYRKVISSNPKSVKVRQDLVNTLVNFGLLRDAADEYEKIIEMEKDNLSIYQKVVDIYNLIGDEQDIRYRYMELANLYRKNNMFDQALDIYQRLVTLDNNDVEAREKIADILLAQKKNKEAIYQYIAVANIYTAKEQVKEVVDIYQKMLKIEPESLLTHVKLAETYAKIGINDKAVEEYMLTAEMYLDKKLWNNAIENYERISELEPHNLDAHLKLSQLYMQNGMSSKAIDANLVIADIFIDQGKLEEALEMAQNIIGAEPEHITAREKLIEIYRRKGLSSKAIADCQNLAEIFLKKNDVDKALEIYEKVLQIEPNNYDIHYKLADLYERKGFTSKGIQEYITMAEIFTHDGNYERAVESFRKAIELDQNNLEARYQLGLLLADKNNDPEGAIEEFEMIRRLSPTHMDALQSLVMTYIKMGRLQQAIQVSKDLKNKEIFTEIVEQYKKALDKNQDDYEARYNLGIIYKEFGDLENAIEQFQLLLKCPEKLLEAYNMLGLCFEQMGMGNLAINQFKKGLSSEGYKDEDYQELRYNLGLLYERRGMLKEALTIYEEAFGVDIKYRDVTQRIQQLEEQVKGKV